MIVSSAKKAICLMLHYQGSRLCEEEKKERELGRVQKLVAPLMLLEIAEMIDHLQLLLFMVC